MTQKYGLKNHAVCLVTIFFINIANQLSATPSSDMQTLMDTKTSILDWGLYRLQDKLRNENAGGILHQVSGEIILSQMGCCSEEMNTCQVL